MLKLDEITEWTDMINNVCHGDCIDFMRLIPDKSIDLVLTSPPYDNLRNYCGDLDWDFKNTAKQIKRILKNGGVCVWIVGDAKIDGSESGSSFRQAIFFQEIGLFIHDTMIYQKDCCPFPSSNSYYQNFEYMFILSNGQPKTFNPICDRKNKSFGRNISGTNRQRNGDMVKIKNSGNEINEFGVRFNVWLVSDGYRQSEHPAVFPLSLARDHVLSWSNKEDIVLDCFLGSGTTARACKDLGRKWIGIEREERYCSIAESRLLQEVLF